MSNRNNDTKKPEQKTPTPKKVLPEKKPSDGTSLLGDGLAGRAATAIKKRRTDREKLLDSL